jgi:hypothetical protein
VPVIPYATALLPPDVATGTGADLVVPGELGVTGDAEGDVVAGAGASGVGNGRGVAPVVAQADVRNVSAITKVQEDNRLIGPIELSAKIAQAVWSRHCFSTPRTSP